MSCSVPTISGVGSYADVPPHRHVAAYSGRNKEGGVEQLCMTAKQKNRPRIRGESGREHYIKSRKVCFPGKSLENSPKMFLAAEAGAEMRLG